MNKETENISVDDNIQLYVPPQYNVILHNDDVTTMDFVVYILERFFKKSRHDAEILMMEVHNNGKTIVGTYSYDIARSKANKASDLAKANNFPLLIAVEKQ